MLQCPIKSRNYSDCHPENLPISLPAAAEKNPPPFKLQRHQILKAKSLTESTSEVWKIKQQRYVCHSWRGRNREVRFTKMAKTLSKSLCTGRDELRWQKTRTEERGSCTAWGCGWWDASLEHEHADILMESIIQAKWVTGWVSHFPVTRHKSPQYLTLLKFSSQLVWFQLFLI